MAKDPRFFSDQEGMPPAEREAYYNRKLRRIIQCAYRNAPAMRARLDTAGVKPGQIRCVKDLEKLPITPKAELRQLQKQSPPFGGLVGCPTSRLKRIFVSPGPIFDVEALHRTIPEARAFYALGFRPGELVMNSFNYHMVRAGWNMDEGLVELGCVIIASGVGNTELQVQVMHDLKVTGFAGTPSFLMTLIKKAEALGYNFRKDFVLNKSYLGAEPLPPSMKRIFEEDYGVSTGDNYGTAELGSLGYSCVGKCGLHVPEEVILEVVDPSTGKQLPAGEIGEVVTTSLQEAFPVLRIGTGDLSYYTDEPCACGRTSRRLLKIVGRVGSGVKVRGMFIQAREVEDLVKSIPAILVYQMLVTRADFRDDLTFKIELAGNAAREEVCNLLETRFQDICRVKIDKVEVLPCGALAPDGKKVVDTRNWD